MNLEEHNRITAPTIPLSADSHREHGARLNSRVTIRALRADLLDAEYTVDVLRGLWGDAADAALRRENPVPARRALAGHAHPAAVLARVFLLGETPGEGELDRALPRTGAQGLRELQMLGEDGRALVDLRPYSAVDALGVVDWWVVSDHGEAVRQGPLAPDHVLGVGGASLTLAGLVPTRRVGRVLDLGTGCGVQSLHARRSADSVVATDVSPRALEHARLTLGLCGIDGVDLRQGDLFAPVEGERFDRIVSNPPFVITPRTESVARFDYRDGGRVGDAIGEEVVLGVADHLVRGGTAHLLANWEYRDGRDGLDRVRDWVERTDLDAWVIERERQTPAEYAETWIRDGGIHRATPDFEAHVGHWLDDFAARGVEAIGFGYVTLRRPMTSGAPRLRRFERVDSARAAGGSGLGDALAQGFAVHDLVAPLSDDDLLRMHAVVAPDVTEERHYWPGDDHPTVLRLRQGAGLGRERDAATALAALVGACDGDLSLGVIIAAVADVLEVDGTALREELVPAVRELLLTGMLRLGEDAPES